MTKIKKTARKYNSEFLDDLLGELKPNEKENLEESIQLAVHIDELVKKQGWNKLTFAEKVGQHPSVISKWLSGTHNFTHETLMNIARVFGIKSYQLLQSHSAEYTGSKEFVLTLDSLTSYIPLTTPPGLRDFETGQGWNYRVLALGQKCIQDSNDSNKFYRGKCIITKGSEAMTLNFTKE